LPCSIAFLGAKVKQGKGDEEIPIYRSV